MPLVILAFIFVAFLAMLWRSTTVLNKAYAAGVTHPKGEIAQGVYFFGAILTAFMLVGTIEFNAL